MAEDDQAAKGDEAEGGKAGLIAKIKSDKKLMMMVGGGALLLLLLIGGAAYYFLSNDTTEDDVATEEEADSGTELDQALDTLGEGDDATSESAQSSFEKVNMYPLKSFFFPIKLKNNQESGRFLLVSPSFNMSNATLGSQISKNLPSIRKRIYNILIKESYLNLTKKTNSTKKRLKERITAKVNELLPVGTGVVQEVYFSEFIVK